MTLPPRDLSGRFETLAFNRSIANSPGTMIERRVGAVAWIHNAAGWTPEERYLNARGYWPCDCHGACECQT